MLAPQIFLIYFQAKLIMLMILSLVTSSFEQSGSKLSDTKTEVRFSNNYNQSFQIILGDKRSLFRLENKIRSLILTHSKEILFCYSSNNYNMKNTNYKCQQALQIIFDVNVLREDAYLFSKIALLEPDKKVRYQHYVDLLKVEDERIKIQNKLEPILEETQINQFWKSYLFQFSNKVYKNIKAFHQKIITLSNKIAEISDTNTFLQQLRNLCIERLTESKNVKQFIHLIIEKLRQRILKQFFILNNFGINNKTIELAKKEESCKNNRYLNILKPKDASLFHRCHQRSLVKLQQECKRIVSKQLKPRNEHPINQYCELLDIEEENTLDQSYQAQNGMMISLAYKDEGFCEFITTKYYRIVKDMQNRNSFNERLINKFRDKCNEVNNRAKKVVKSSTVYDDYFKRSQKKSELIRQDDLQSSFQMKNITNLTYHQKEEITIEQQDNSNPPKKGNVFKIQRVEARKKSHTLKPLGQSKQNNKQVVHQRLLEMKLEQEPLQIAKILRIRKRKHFPIFRQQNEWSLIVKENKSKVSFLIH